MSCIVYMKDVDTFIVIAVDISVNMCFVLLIKNDISVIIEFDTLKI